MLPALAPDDGPLRALQAWAGEHARPLEGLCQRLAAATHVCAWRALAGPTGEANLYALLPHEAVLCLAERPADPLAQLAAVLAVGSHAVWPAHAMPQWQSLPEVVRERVALAQDWRQPAVLFDAVLYAGPDEALRDLAQALAQRPGPLLGLARFGADAVALPLERLVIERSVSVNTAAAGGNASLMTLD